MVEQSGMLLHQNTWASLACASYLDIPQTLVSGVWPARGFPNTVSGCRGTCTGRSLNICAGDLYRQSLAAGAIRVGSP